MDKRAEMLSDWEMMENFNKSIRVFPFLCSEGNGCVYRLDAFVTDWRDNPDDLPDRVKAPYASFVWNGSFSKYYPIPQSYYDYPSTRAYKYTEDKKAFDKRNLRLNKIEERKYRKALDSADKRPLHRKNSLNRAFD